MSLRQSTMLRSLMCMVDFIHIVGARPNFMKASPVWDALAERGASQMLIHSGQHYDEALSAVFFEQLGMPRPDVNLGVGSGSHASQTAEIMVGLEPLFEQHKPKALILYGDVNSTLAAAIVAAKMGIRIAHVEAGLRSFDRDMPEEINRLVTDALSEWYFTPSADGDEHLLSEGVPESKIHRVGNVMIDTLVRLLPRARCPEGLDVEPGAYGLVTLHRPSNVDDAKQLGAIFSALSELRELPIIFPMHPRTRARVEEFGLTVSDHVQLVDPLGYLEFLWLQQHAVVVLTDGGGMQEETTYLQVPCLTLRENTERPITCSEGTNELIGQDMPRLIEAVRAILAGQAKSGRIPEGWDGKASERIADVLMSEL